jgi:hypothetical protein
LKMIGRRVVDAGARFGEKRSARTRTVTCTYRPSIHTFISGNSRLLAQSRAKKKIADWREKSTRDVRRTFPRSESTRHRDTPHLTRAAASPERSHPSRNGPHLLIHQDRVRRSAVRRRRHRHHAGHRRVEFRQGGARRQGHEAARVESGEEAREGEPRKAQVRALRDDARATANRSPRRTRPIRRIVTELAAFAA